MPANVSGGEMDIETLKDALGSAGAYLRVRILYRPIYLFIQFRLKEDPSNAHTRHELPPL